MVVGYIAPPPLPSTTNLEDEVVSIDYFSEPKGETEKGPGGDQMASPSVYTGIQSFFYTI